MKSVRESMLLYVITDRTWLAERSLSAQVEEALAAGATCLQLREKELGYEDFLAEARRLKPIAAKYGVPFIVNDNIDVAIESGAGGVHVGQSDMGAAQTRKRIGDKMILGVSAQTVEQALLAERSGADYIGVGAVFSTDTKPDADAVSYDTLKKICQSVKIPVVAIGGITERNVSALWGSGIDGIAVVSAVFSKPDIAQAVRGLLSLAKKAVMV